MSKMLGSDLTYKQFLFCEEYLKHFCADEAFRKAYPKCNHRAAPQILKSRKVVEYIKARLEEKKATIERLTDRMYNVLLESSLSPDSEIALEATKQISKLKEIEARVNELESKQNTPTDSQNEQTLNINFKVAGTDDTN